MQHIRHNSNIVMLYDMQHIRHNSNIVVFNICRVIATLCYAAYLLEIDKTLNPVTICGPVGEIQQFCWTIQNAKQFLQHIKHYY